MKNLLLSLFLVVQCALLAQSDHNQQIASGISRYRAFLLEDKVVERQYLGVVLKKLERMHIPEEDRSHLAALMAGFSRRASSMEPVAQCRRWAGLPAVKN